MKISDLVEKLGANPVVMHDENREVIDGYAGDFLSHVMAKAPSDSAWFTIMNNINVAAVATLSDVSVVVLCEGSMPDNNLKEKAEQNGINIIVTELDVFKAVKAF